jgi:hypothetical protein
MGIWKHKLVAVTAAGTVLLGPGPAFAAPEETPQPSAPRIAGEVLGPGADATVVLDARTIKEAREQGVAGDLTDAEHRTREVLLDASERAGGSLDEHAVDVVSLLDGDVILAVPLDIDVTEITVEVDGGRVDVSALASPTSDAVASGGGPGMAPYWANDGDGQYVLTVTGLGDALFVWQRRKLMDDGDSRYTWYAYKRKGSAQPFTRTGPDARVETLRVQSYPYDSIQSGLLNWVDWDPASSFSGNEGTPLTVSVSVLGVDTSISFADRDKYTVWRNANNPGSYWIEMDQGYTIDTGSRAAGYAVAWKATQGTSGSQHDFQRVVFYFNGDGYTCDQYAASDTCTPNGIDQ